MSGPSGSFGDFFAETRFFEADLRFFQFRRQAADVQALLRFLHRSLGSFDIDVFSLFGDFGQNRHLGRSHFGKSPENRHIVPDVFGLIPQFTDPKSGQAPFTNLLDAAGYGMALPNGGVTIASVAKRGTQFAVCDMATNRLAGLIATSTKGVQEAVYTELVRNLIPNSHLMSAGVVAVTRAQEYGYTLLTAV